MPHRLRSIPSDRWLVRRRGGPHAALHGLLAPSPSSPKASAQMDEREAGARGVATFVQLIAGGAHKRLPLVFHGENTVTVREVAMDSKLRQTARRLRRDDLEMEGLAS